MASVASTYARAFADVVFSAHLDASRAVGGLREIARLLSENVLLRRVWENPAIPADQKRNLLDAVVQPARATLPELEVLGQEPIATPVGRTTGIVAVSLSSFGETPLDRLDTDRIRSVEHAGRFV